jgi:replicative DNA helicase
MKLNDVEKQVFRKLISNPATLATTIHKLSPEDFTIPVIRHVISAFGENASNVAHYTPSASFFEILLRNRIHEPKELENAANMIAGIAAKPIDPKDLDVMIKELKANRMCREMANLIQAAIPSIKPDSIEEAYESLLKSLLGLPLRGITEGMVAKLREVHEQLEERVMSYLDAAKKKIPACIKAFDAVMGGFAEGEHVVIAAGTGQGKSNLMLWWAEQMVERGLNVLYITIEMSYEETMNRYHAIQTGFPVLDIAHKRIDKDEVGEYFEKLIAANKDPNVRNAFLKECTGIKHRGDPKGALRIAKKYKDREAKLFMIDIESCTPSRVEQEAQRIMMDASVDVIFVDFLNVMDADFPNKDRVRELTSISRGLKKLARKTNTVVFTAAQLDTTLLEGKQDEKISTDRIKYARAIAENSDWMFAFHRTAEDTSLKQIRIQSIKHRHSSDSTALIEFDFATMQAMDLGFANGSFIPDGYNQFAEAAPRAPEMPRVIVEASDKEELPTPPVDAPLEGITKDLDSISKIFSIKKVVKEQVANEVKEDNAVPNDASK